eukprot:TRINITY_DN6709_c0_g2_i2.p1 TRINITY_DN6709_c0_g2~~TRINITY_DN6709_c0_g2_i2.p1  ORF type:complete len:261 (-),score=62.45 TRINITY_DN6709_c0_g2_i2:348-1130(-)
MTLVSPCTSVEAETAAMVSSCGFKDKSEKDDKESDDSTDMGSSCCSSEASEASDSEEGSYQFKQKLLQSWREQQAAQTAGTMPRSQATLQLQLHVSNRRLRSSVAPPRQVRIRGSYFRGTQLRSIPCTPAAASSTWISDSSSDSSGDEALDKHLRQIRVCNAFLVAREGETDQAESSVDSNGLFSPAATPGLPPPPLQQANLDFQIPPLPEPPVWDSNGFAFPVAAPPSYPAPVIAEVQSYVSSSPPMWEAGSMPLFQQF